MQMAVEHKHKIGFQGPLLIEPKPHEPTKHQYDFDAAAVFAFLQKYNLEKEISGSVETEQVSNIPSGVSIESASYIESNNLENENAQAIPQHDEEEHTPKLFSEDQSHQSEEMNTEINDEDNSSSEQLFDQDINEEEDFEIPAFLRKQKF